MRHFDSQTEFFSSPVHLGTAEEFRSTKEELRKEFSNFLLKLEEAGVSTYNPSFTVTIETSESDGYDYYVLKGTYAVGG